MNEPTVVQFANQMQTSCCDVSNYVLRYVPLVVSVGAGGFQERQLPSELTPVHYYMVN